VVCSSFVRLSALVFACTLPVAACASDDPSGPDTGDSNASSASTTDETTGSDGSGSTASESGETATDSANDTGVGLDCTDDPNVCTPGTECSCFDKTGDGTMVSCACAASCQADSDCMDPERPLCGCSGDGPVCMSNCDCFCG
jgi:hypothetical protein